MFVVWLFLAVSWVCLQFVIVVFPDHTDLLILKAQPRQRISKIYIYLYVSCQSVCTGSEIVIFQCGIVRGGDSSGHHCESGIYNIGQYVMTW